MSASWSAHWLFVAGLLGGDAGEAIVISVDTLPGISRPVGSTDVGGQAAQEAIVSVAATPTAAPQPAAPAPAGTAGCASCQAHRVVEAPQTTCTNCQTSRCRRHHTTACASCACEPQECTTCPPKKHGFFTKMKGWFSHSKQSCSCKSACSQCTEHHCTTSVCTVCPTGGCASCTTSTASAPTGATTTREAPITLPAAAGDAIAPMETLRSLPVDGASPKAEPAPIPRTMPQQKPSSGPLGPAVSAPKRIEGTLAGPGVVKPTGASMILPQSQPVLPKKADQRRGADEPNFAPDYSWVEGTLQKVHVRGGAWVVRYLPLDQADKNGGSIVLARDARMDVFKEGDVVRVHGEILNNKPTASLGGPLYRIQKVSLVRSGEPNLMK